MTRLIKYPRTPHLEGSRSQPGDEDLDAVPFSSVRGCHLAVEEKIDGANAAIRFVDGELRLQSRGHFLRGGARERHFALLKTWAHRHEPALRDRLGERYVLYGEWVHAKHTIFYDRLPHYFMEFDVLDLEQEIFLDTPSRRRLLNGSPVVSVPVLAERSFEHKGELAALIGRSLYKSTSWRQRLEEAAQQGESGRFGSVERALAQTDPSDLAEGLYLKHEEEGAVRARYKLVRHSFLTQVLDSDSHWLDRPIVQNGLAEDVDIFEGVP
jgi:RNA ligase